MLLSFSLKPWSKTHGLNVRKTSCDSHTHCVYFNSCQIVDGITYVMKHGHHLGAYSEGLKNIWGPGVHSSPLYSLYCTLKMFTFDPKPLMNPMHSLLEETTHWCP
jgi:hypothetical protein